MKQHFGRVLTLSLLATAFGLAAAIPANAQEQASAVTSPPKVLVIYNEILKAGQSGGAHQKTENAFVQAFAAAKWPEHYIAMDALSGKERTLFFAGYDCLDSWQKDMDATEKNPTLAAALDSARMADGALLESHETSTYLYREDLSLRAPVEMPRMRFMDIAIFNIRPGHDEDWNALAKMYIQAAQKLPKAHWATFEKVYGVASGSRFIVVTPRRSLAEADQDIADEKALNAAMGGPDQLQKVRDLTAAAVESSESHIFQINPRMSYANDNWVKADPEFWNQK